MKIKELFRNKKLQIILSYAGIAFAVLLPILFKRGYIFALDMQWVDKIQYLNFDQIYNDLPFYFLLKFLSLLLSSGLTQRLILFLILFLSGTNGFLLAKKNSKNNWIAFACGLFYMINPFVYSRLGVGHWKFMLGYSLTPLYILSLVRLFGQENGKNWIGCKNLINQIPTGILPVALLFTIISSISVHHSILLILFNLYPIVVIIFSKSRNVKFLKFLILNLSFLILNLFWLVPAILSKTQLSYISQEQLYYFSPSPDNKFGLILNLLSLYGFWGENSVISNLAKSSLGILWPLLSLLLYLPAGIAILKFKTLDKNKKLIVLSFTLIAILSFILAHGVGMPFYKIYIFLFKYVPGFNGFRDSGKFLSVFIICIVVLNAIGMELINKTILVTWLHGRIAKLLNCYIVGLFCALIIILNFNFFTLVKNEWKLAKYPDAWYEARQIIYSDPGSVEVIPPDAYLFVPFLHKHTANPAYAFIYKDGVTVYQYFELYEYTNCSDPEKVTRNCEIEEEKKEDENIRYKFVVDSDEIEEIGEGWEVVLEDKEMKTMLLRRSN